MNPITPPETSGLFGTRKTRKESLTEAIQEFSRKLLLPETEDSIRRLLETHKTASPRVQIKLNFRLDPRNDGCLTAGMQTGLTFDHEGGFILHGLR